MSFYNLDFRQLVLDYIPPFSRNKTFVAFLDSCIAPIKGRYNWFKEFKNQSLYRVQHNSQIAYMEAVLNDLFDNNNRRIRIQNVQFKEAIYFYEPEENREVFFYETSDNRPVYFYEPEDLIGEGVDFVVCVPPDLRPIELSSEVALLTHMSAQVDYYKLYSKNYKIIWVQVEL